jgi:Concanavalin A-like lectin/glucanases superfamily
MTVIVDSEVGASGRYINLGAPSAHNDLANFTVMVYARLTAAGGGGFGYLFGKTPSNASGVRLFYSDNGGAPRLTGGLLSSLSATPLKNTLNNTVVYNTWQNFCWVVSGATIGGSDTPVSVISLYIDGTLVSTTADDAGLGFLTADAAYDMFLLNRGNSGALGRELVGEVAYVARWNQALNSTRINNAISTGPLNEPSGLILCWANGQDYSPLALTPVARSTRVAGSAPPNTALGGGGSATVNGQILTATASLIAGAASGGGSATVAGQLLTATASLIAGSASGVVNGVLSFTLKNNAGTPLANLTGVVVNIYNPSTGALVHRATGRTTNGSGLCTVISSAISPGTSYAFEPDLTSSAMGRRLPLQTAT